MIQLYNDAALAIVRGKHPKDFGVPAREAWSEIWDSVGPLLEGVLSSAKPVLGEDLELLPARGGSREPAFFTFSYSALRDESNAVAGVVSTAIETTARVLADRRRDAAENKLGESEERHAFLLKLSDALSPLENVADITREATRMLGEALGANRVFYGSIEADGDTAEVSSVYANGVASGAGRYSLTAFAPKLVQEWRAGRTTVTSDVNADPRFTDAQRQAYASVAARAAVGVPLVKGERLVAVLGMNSVAPRAWTDREVRLAKEVAERTWAAVARSRAEAALRESEERQTFLLRLSDAMRQERDVETTASAALRLLREHLHLDRTYVARIRGQDQPVDIVAEYGRADLVPMPERLQPADFPEGFKKAAQGVFVVDNIWEHRELAEMDRRSLDSIALTSFIVAPLHRGSEGMIWALIAGSAEPRPWTQNETLIMVEAAERIWTALERAGAEAALRENEERFRSFGEASSDVLWIRDAETLQWTYLTPAFETIYGADRERALEGDNLMRWGALILAEDREHAMAQIERVLQGERVTFEYRIKRPFDGSVRWLRNTDFPLLDTVGRVRAVGGIGRDVTKEKELADRMEVLVAELQHRTRNLMTVVRSVVSRSWRESQSLEDLGETLLERVDALSRAQALLSQRVGGTKIAFDELLRAELSAHTSLDEQESRVTLAGPAGVRLPSRSVQTLALAIHELTTNAIKYGALSQPQGHLEVNWKIEPVAVTGPAHLVIDWHETGIAMPESGAGPQGGGYGRELIERALPYQLQASTTYVLGSEGVHCTIALPVSAAGTEEPDQ